MYPISVIIPTYNGEQKILHILTALAQQTYKDFETVIVIDGSTDNTAQVLTQNLPSIGLTNVKIIEQPNGGRSIARNRGAKEASSDLLLFFDDDMLPTATCVAQHLSHHTKSPNSLLVGPAIEDIQRASNDFLKYKALKLHHSLIVYQGYLHKMDKDAIMVTAANFSIPESLFWQLNGFDERLTDAEDYDLGVRAFLQNIPIYFDMAIIAWHNDFPTIQTFIKRQREYTVAQKRLRELSPALYAVFTQYEIPAISPIKKFIYGFFAQRFWLWSISTFNWLKIFHSKLRYKIYDIIITAFAVYFPHRKL
jgi:glycosyltransferase involved in cell wall biosynthesis